MLQIELPKVADIPTLGDGFSLVTRAISNDGAGLFLFVENKAEESVSQLIHKENGVFPATSMAELAC